MKFCILLSFFLTTLLWSQEKRENPTPKSLFSIMLWNTQGSQDLGYAPWGNESEGNGLRGEVRAAQRVRGGVRGHAGESPSDGGHACGGARK